MRNESHQEHSIEKFLQDKPNFFSLPLMIGPTFGRGGVVNGGCMGIAVPQCSEAPAQRGIRHPRYELAGDKIQRKFFNSSKHLSHGPCERPFVVLGVPERPCLQGRCMIIHVSE